MEIHTRKYQNTRKTSKIETTDLGSYLWLTHSFKESWKETTAYFSSVYSWWSLMGKCSMFFCLCLVDTHLQLCTDLASYKLEEIQNGKWLGTFCCDKEQRGRHTLLKISIVSKPYQKCPSTVDDIPKKIHLVEPKLIRTQNKMKKLEPWLSKSLINYASVWLPEYQLNSSVCDVTYVWLSHVSFEMYLLNRHKLPWSQEL